MYREKTNVIYYTNLVCDEMNKCYDDYERCNNLYNMHSALMNFTGSTLTTINGEFVRNLTREEKDTCGRIRMLKRGLTWRMNTKY